MNRVVMRFKDKNCIRITAMRTRDAERKRDKCFVWQMTTKTSKHTIRRIRTRFMDANRKINMVTDGYFSAIILVIDKHQDTEIDTCLYLINPDCCELHNCKHFYTQAMAMYVWGFFSLHFCLMLFTILRQLNAYL